MKHKKNTDLKPPVHLTIIGGGKGGTAILQALYDDPLVRIIGMADLDPKAPGVQLARRLRIPTATSPLRLLKNKRVDLVMNVTGSSDVTEELEQRFPNVEVMGGFSSKFLWDLIEARIKRKEEAERLLFEYQSLYELGLKLNSSDNLDKLFKSVVEYAAQLTGTPAGSLAIMDERRGEMFFGALKGFSKRFARKVRWKLRQGGLTSTILNQDDPLVISDVNRFPRFDNPLMLREGIKSLMAAPLKAEGKIIGILYVDDFVVRHYTPREISLLSLLSTIAAMAIEKTRVLENTRLLAITDELTGLFNHRHFRQQLFTEVQRVERYGRALSLMMIDIDYFKHYNDTNGHLKGNNVLRDLGRILKDLSREVDIVARYGGEEFSIILPETERRKARSLAERLRRKIEQHDFENSESQPNGRLTVSIGTASFPDNASTAFDLLEQADRALYTAKRQGRNQVCVSTKKG
jgi:diguanylate cyclase (GGDEF)-like protein